MAGFWGQETQLDTLKRIYGGELVSQAEDILDNAGLDTVTACRMMLKRIVKEKDASFLLAKREEQTKAQQNGYYGTPNFNDNTMTKNRAIALFRGRGADIQRMVTFASRNRSSGLYWANPNFYALGQPWSLILNDWHNRILYLFEIPENSFKRSDLLSKNDNWEVIDLQIMYDDPTFTDTRSKQSFAKYLVETIQY